MNKSSIPICAGCAAFRCLAGIDFTVSKGRLLAVGRRHATGVGVPHHSRWPIIRRWRRGRLKERLAGDCLRRLTSHGKDDGVGCSGCQGFGGRRSISISNRLWA
ncbi:unnamed protein product, partial [Musa acuminata subsp. burmannicoides]